ncbi:MAG: OmpA family protein [Thiogranum sp.]|nr:OmpA family protein [Thiogranum sp.]
MKQIIQSLVLAGVTVATGSAFAASGYVDAPGAGVVRTGYGDCLHTARWSEANAIAECDPEIVAARDKPTEVAAIEVVTVKELKPISLEADALFAFDSAELTADGRARLDEVAGALDRKAIQNTQIEVTGYTDRIGPDRYNQALSERRAQAVRDYLVSAGLPADAISTQGLGSAKPVVDCEGKSGAGLIECLAPNRRTEIEFSAMEVIEVEKEIQKTVPAQ